MQGDPRRLTGPRAAFWFWLTVAAMVLGPPWWLWVPAVFIVGWIEERVLGARRRQLERRRRQDEHRLDAEILAAATGR